MAFYTDVRWAFLIVGVIVMVDTYYGIRASLYQNIPFLSKYLFRIVPKTIMYCLTFAILYAIDYHVVNSLISLIVDIDCLLSKVVLLGIGIIEGISIDEKRVILGKKSFAELFNKVFSVIKTGVGKLNEIKNGNRAED